MALTKQSVNINFAQGLDTKTDEFQVPVGKFLDLQNTIFTKGGLLQKRNGYASLPNLPDTSFTTLSTFNGDLTGLGTNLYALSEGYNQWVNRGKLQPMELSTLTLIRNNTNQSQSDTAISETGLVCTVYTEQDPANLANSIYMYAVADVVTGQNIIAPTRIATGAVVNGGSRVFLMGNYFVIVFDGLVGADHNLRYFAVSTFNPNVVSPIADAALDFVPRTTLAFDGVVFNSSLYLAWNASDGIRMTFINPRLAVVNNVLVDAAHHANLFSLTADEGNQSIWVTYYDITTTNMYSLVVSPALAIILAPTLLTTDSILNIASVAINHVMTVVYEINLNYSYNAVPTHFLRKKTVTQSGVVAPAAVLIRSVGLASKAFMFDGDIYFLAVYQSPYQNTYFLINTDAEIVAELAYSNGGGYITKALPSVSLMGNQAQVSYLINDLVQAVNKNTNIPAGNQVAGVYSQRGINLATFIFNNESIITAEIGNNLNITGGITWAYDGYSSVEQEFFLYPDNIVVTPSLAAGAMAPQLYFYQVTYEWTDNQGNAFKSAPSIPVSINLSTSFAVDVHVPTLRITYKTANPVKIVIYRWSLAQQSYYQVTSIITPVLNNTAIDSITFADTLSDVDILGNNLLYTTGGILENIGPPSFSSIFIFDDRLWGITSEDRNLLWYSKQVLQATPVEFSDLQTIYVAPNIGAQGPTGSLTCGAAMDDKLILFKASAINYLNGTGPDAAGANNQYSQPIFITSTVGCSNQKSIVFQPQGLMFEFANKAGNQIWLLGRDLSTSFIGAPVEKFTLNATVKSAINIPGTNQIRFTMSNGITLMFDTYYQQWGSFINIPAISSTVYQGLHSYLNQFGNVFKESPGVYLDGSTPVLVSFTTSWLNLAGLQGYERAYRFYLLGTYRTPHKLNLQIAYDYNPFTLQFSSISPTNFSPAYGNDLTYGSGDPYGGPGNIEQWRVFLKYQRCESFQITLNEQYDPKFGVPAGAGLTLSGINCVVGLKAPYRPLKVSQSVG